MVLGIRGIEDSSVYQDIFAKGRAEARPRAARGLVEEAREILIGLGRKKLGEPHEQVLSKIAAIRDLDHLNLLLDRILDAPTWEELTGLSRSMRMVLRPASVPRGVTRDGAALFDQPRSELETALVFRHSNRRYQK